MWSAYAMHRRRDFFGDDAEEFRPDRWTQESHPWVSLCLLTKRYPGLSVFILK